MHRKKDLVYASHTADIQQPYGSHRTAIHQPYSGHTTAVHTSNHITIDHTPSDLIAVQDRVSSPAIRSLYPLLSNDLIARPISLQRFYRCANSPRHRDLFHDLNYSSYLGYICAKTTFEKWFVAKPKMSHDDRIYHSGGAPGCSEPGCCFCLCGRCKTEDLQNPAEMIREHSERDDARRFN